MSTERISMQNNAIQNPHMQKSLSIADVIGAGKLIKPVAYDTVSLALESFDIVNKIWKRHEAEEFDIEKESFGTGGFRHPFRATKKGKLWVVKKFREDTWHTLEPLLGDITLAYHTRKQVQMHMAAKEILNRLKKNIKDIEEFFGEMFSYDTIYFALLGDLPVTLEPFLPGKFCKYINNNGIPEKPGPGDEDLYEKAEAVSHFSLAESGGKLLLLDLQGVGHNLCDPEIATSSINQNGQDEQFFCAGNPQDHAYETFFAYHVCNTYCRLLSLKHIDPENQYIKKI